MYMKGFMKQLFTIVMVFAMVLTMMPAGSVAFAMEDGTDVTAEDQLTIDDQTDASEAQDLTVQEPESSDNPDSEEEAPTGDVPSEDAEETESFVLTEEAAEPVANAPEVKAAADENEALPENYKFRTRISSDSAAGTGSVTGTVYADYNADLVFAGPSVSRTNATLELWMQNVASLGVDSQRYYKRTVATGLTGNDTQMEAVKAYFNGLNGKTTKIVGKIDDKSTTYTVTRDDNGNIKAVTDEEAAREVWHAIVNEENMTAGTGEDDSYITIANGSYIQIGNQILEFKNKDGEDLKLDDFSKLNAMDEQIRAAVALNTAEEMIENVVIYLEPGTILSVGESQVELNKDAKMTIDIDGVDERTLSPILTELKSAKDVSQLITKGLGGMSQILTLMGGKTTTVTFEFGHNFGEPTYTWAEDNSTVTAVLECSNNEKHNVTETVNTTKEVTAPTCEEAGSVTYTATFKNEAFKAQTKTAAGDPATGHKYGAPEYKWSEDNKTVTATMVCENDKTHVVTETAETVSKTTPATCEEAGSITYTATFKNEAFKAQTKTAAGDPATGHKWGKPEWTWSEDKSEATAKFTCETDKNHVKEVKAEITKKEDADTVTYTASVTGPDGKTYTDNKTEAIVYDDILRIFGATRYSTAFKNADRLKEVLGVEKFDTVVVATGVDFPDSLSGAYLANIKDAPMLLISQKDAENVKAYIRNNLKAGGTIYILGGEGVVKDSWLSGLDFTKKRLAGPTRYETNLAILEEVGYTGGDILAATGVDYPDSLSGSYLDMPILLVKGNTLTKDQTAFLKGLKDKPNFYIAGGTGAVSAAMEKTLGTNGTIAKRFAGLDRYETSRLIAEEFYKAPKEVVLAVGTAFPDGLSVGPLAAKMKAPMLLAHNKEKSASASVYTRAKNIRTGVVIGGPLLIWDATAKEVLHNDSIELYEEDKYNN